MAPPVGRVAPALEIAPLLELVEQQNAVVGVHPQVLTQLLLEGGPAPAQVAEQHELADRYAEQILAAPLLNDLGQPQEHHNGPGRRLYLHLDFFRRRLRRRLRQFAGYQDYHLALMIVHDTVIVTRQTTSYLEGMITINGLISGERRRWVAL